MIVISAQLLERICEQQTARQQAQGMELLYPLAIQHIRFSPLHVLGLADQNQQHLIVRLLQGVEQGLPIAAGRGRYPTGLKMGNEFLEAFGVHAFS